MVKTTKQIISCVFPDTLKMALENGSKQMGCSQSELVRVSVYDFLNDLGLIRKQLETNARCDWMGDDIIKLMPKSWILLHELWLKEKEKSDCIAKNNSGVRS